MVRSSFKRFLAVVFAAALSACGSGDGSPDQATQTMASVASKQSFDENSILGYWQPRTAGDEAYEFYATALNAALQRQPLTGPKTGRIFKNGEVSGMFHWSVGSNGRVILNHVALSCSLRPLDLCPTISTTNIAIGGTSPDGAVWRRSTANAALAKAGVYTQPKLDLTGLNGPFLMNAADLFTMATSAQIANGRLTITTQELNVPVPLSAQLPSGPVAGLSFAAGEATAVVLQQMVPTTSGVPVRMPVKLWLDDVVLGAGANDGFILRYNLHRKVQIPAGVDPSTLLLAEFEKPAAGTDAFGRIASYVQGPAVQAGQTYFSMMPLLFNQVTTVSGAGNVIRFTSASEGVISHTDIHNGKYSETLRFMWAQRADGALNLVIAEGPFAGFPITVRFVKAVTGGHQAVFSFPDVTYPVTNYILSDFVQEGAPSVTAATLPGKYLFDSTDGMTKNEVTFHRDGRVSGVVGGHWFIDADGDVVSFECTDLQGRDLTSYDDCFKVFDSVDTLKTYAFAHIRKMRFMHTANGVSQVRYDSVFYGSRFEVVNRDYAMVAWTYRFTRTGDE